MKVFLTICLTLYLTSAAAAVFTVTSNADAGPGTLREAIQLANANGSVVQDLIQFNFSDLSVGGRTITLQTALPFLSSNIIIDGTTQPGPNFGVSDTRVLLTGNPTSPIDYGFAVLGIDHVEIYGIFFKDISGQQISFYSAGILLGNAHDIRIGAPGKGNMFAGHCTAINAQGSPATPVIGILSRVVIQSNIIGLSEDGTDIAPSGSYGVHLGRVQDLLFGGTQDTEGNFLSSNIEYPFYVVADSTMAGGKITIDHNFFGVNHDRTVNLKFNGVFFEPQNFATDNCALEFHGNMVNNRRTPINGNTYKLLNITGKKGYIDIRSNLFNTLYDPGTFIGTGTYNCIFMTNCDDGIIGGDIPTDANTISYAEGPGVFLEDCRNIRLSRNSIFCNSSGTRIYSSRVNVPVVKIMQTDNATQASGTSVPFSTVQVFETTSCGSCANAQRYLGETMADASGAWSFTGPFAGALSAIATTTAGNSGEIALPRMLTTYLDYRNPTCGKPNGKLTGMQVTSGTGYYWLHYDPVVQTFDTIRNKLDLVDIGPGSYTFAVEQTRYCSVQSGLIILKDTAPVFRIDSVEIVQPSCGKASGSIRLYGLGDNGVSYWVNADRQITYAPGLLTDLGPGRYKWIIEDTVGHCGDSTAWFELKNMTGASWDSSTVLIQAARCGKPTGSIRGLRLLNDQPGASLSWKDSTGRVSGTGLDLIDVPTGRYRLSYMDGGGCDTLFSSWYRVGDEGALVTDSSLEHIVPSACQQSNGAITGWKIMNAEAWTWTAISDGSVAGHGQDLIGVRQGRYRLTATNSLGCQYMSRIIEVPATGFHDVPYTAQRSFKATCDTNNAFFNVTAFAGDTAGYRFWFTDSTTGLRLSDGTTLNGLGAGTFQFRASDNAGCEKIVETFTVIPLPKPIIDLSGLAVSDDFCDFAQGSVRGIRLKGLAGPTSFSWTDRDGKEVGNTLELRNVRSGEYVLHVTDAATCTMEARPIVVSNHNEYLEGLHFSSTNLVIPRNTAAHIEVLHPDTGTYVLSLDSAFSNVLGSNGTGKFETGVLANDARFYVTRLAGACNSPWVVINVHVVDETVIYVPNAFTPNGDGLNDRLQVRVYGLADQASFTIYDRWGEMVFSTNDLGLGWDGYYKGSRAPVGTYTWHLTAKDVHGAPVNKRGTITLIR